MRIRTRALSLLLGLTGLTCTPAVFAQASPQSPVEQTAPASNYSDSELKTFAVAALEVQRINDAYVQKLESAKSPEEQQQLRQTASQEMVRAVEKEGMSVDKYKEIMSQAKANPAVAERVQQHIMSNGK
jgi:hypothetical protein